ncbi:MULTISPECIES: RHS repeat-associated core domain-containing protein [unclassified Pseudomonas]|uniref:RHS repeat-associated core domain-containing protein n=1 Tax=unclassified Pseudomonas TaxID=196821 RepID=UPI001CBC067E|nr:MULTISPECIES: RHS repeat-associated core domain-containing protein [unclassified Pseudomonas]
MQPQLAFLHRDTPSMTVVEPRGLAVRSVDYYRAAQGEVAEARVNRTVHDPAGRAIAQWDPRLFLETSAPANLSSILSLSDTALSIVSVDAGLSVNLFGEADQPVQSWDGRGSQRWMHYDNRLRLTALFEQTAGGEAVCAERLTYAANDPASADHNQCGQLIRHDDRAGTQLFPTFGLTGGLLEQTRHFLRTLEIPDWPEHVDERDTWLEPGSGATTRSRFNPLGEAVEQTDAQGNRQLFSHTVAGQLREVQLQLRSDTTPKTLVSAIQYNAHGQTEREVAGNGVITTLEYAPEDARLTRLHARRGNDVLQDSHYEYDPTGNVLRIEDAAVSIRYFANQRIDPVNGYAYDSLNQLIRATGWEAGGANRGPQFSAFDDPAPRGNYCQSYRYDRGGNLLELIHEGPQKHGHRLVAAPFSNRCLPVIDGVDPGEEDFRRGFDANGNLLTLQPGQTLSWDLRNQLCEVRPVERDGASDDSEHYVYGADGMRVRKVRSTQTNARTVLAEVRYLPGLEMRTHSGTGEVLHVINVQAGRSSVRVLHWETAPPKDSANDQYRFCLSDHLGSSTLELDSDGEVISQERYHPFGTTAWFAGMGEVEASRKTVRYSGKERDATGLYYYGLRYYVAWLQRWLSPDPARDIDGLNLYRMVGNSPVNDFDIKGLASSGLFNRLGNFFSRLVGLGNSKGRESSGVKSSKPDAPGENAPAYERAVFTLAQRSGKIGDSRVFSDFKAGINNSVAQQDVKIEGFLYRSHHVSAISYNGLERASRAVEPGGDEYIAQLFQHSGMQSGLSGRVLSFTPDVSIAKRFSKREGNILVRVSTDLNSLESEFRTMANIVTNDAERLVQENKIRIPSLVNVLGYMGQGEIETFYMGGDVPHEAVQIRYDGGWISIHEYLTIRESLPVS